VLVPRSHLYADNKARGSSQPPDNSWLRLHRNERVSPFSQREHDAMMSAILVTDMIRYPDQTEILSALSADLRVSEPRLSLYAGSESAIRVIFDVMVDPEDSVLCLQPSYHGYSRQAFLHRAVLQQIRYDDAMSLDLSAVLSTISPNTRVVILGSPDATGRAFPADFLLDALARVERYDGLLVVDEAYHYFGAPSILGLLPAHPQLVILRTFSKAWGLAGIRCGFTIGEPSTTRLLRRASLQHEVSGPALAVARYVLEHPELRDEYAREIANSRDLFTRVLTECGFAVIPSVANFLVARVPEAARADVVLEQARAAKILLTKLTPDFIRVTIGSRDAMRPAIDHFQSLPNLT
jgi:histidinol-phosphate aminotransferase